MHSSHCAGATAFQDIWSLYEITDDDYNNNVVADDEKIQQKCLKFKKINFSIEYIFQFSRRIEKFRSSLSFDDRPIYKHVFILKYSRLESGSTCHFTTTNKNNNNNNEKKYKIQTKRDIYYRDFHVFLFHMIFFLYIIQLYWVSHWLT